MTTKKVTPPSSLAPYDADAEAQVIGSLLRWPQMLNKADLCADDFWDRIHRDIFSAFVNLSAANKEVNVASVHTETEIDIWKLENLQQNVVAVSHFHLHRDRLRKMSLKRNLIEIAGWLAKSSYDTENPVEVFEKAFLQLGSLAWPKIHHRLVTFSNGIITTSENPTYEFTVSLNKKSQRVTFDSEDWDSRTKVGRRIREVFHINPILPDVSHWADFVSSLLSDSTEIEAPQEAKTGGEISFWIREWFKSATPAESVDDLAKGYVAKGKYIYFQPERMQKWINDNIKLQKRLKLGMLWQYVSWWGGQRDKAIKLDKKTRRFWGLPKAFFEEEDVDISFLND